MNPPLRWRPSRSGLIPALIVLSLVLSTLACNLPFIGAATEEEDTAPPQPQATVVEEEPPASDEPSSSDTPAELLGAPQGVDLSLFTSVLEEETFGRVLQMEISNDSDAYTRLYWTDPGTAMIQRANVDGTGIEDLVTEDLIEPRGIALDLLEGKMYWVDAGTDKIQAALLNGQSVEDRIPGVAPYPFGIALDGYEDRMVWTDQEMNLISDARLDGFGQIPLHENLNESPLGVAMDLATGTLYWIEADAIHRSNLDGSQSELLVPGLNSGSALALDTENEYIYWTETDRIRRANYAGQDIKDLVQLEGVSYGIALDLRDGKMYWTDFDGGKIQRANLDGSEVEDVVIELDTPSGLALELGGEAIIRLPCGLVFYPAEGGEGPDTMQQLMVVQEERVTVGSGETATLTPFVACIETEKAVPGMGADYYPTEMATGELLKLAQCICEEPLMDYEDDPMTALGQLFTLQFTVWEVAEGRTYEEMIDSVSDSPGALASYAEAVAMIEQAGEFIPGYVDWMEKCGIELGGE